MRNLVILFSFLVLALISLTLFVGVTKINPKQILNVIHPHFYNNDQVSIEKIKITVFYFIPKDALTKKQDNWKEITEKHLRNLIDFHTVIFENTSKITYEFFPEIITGEKTTKEYESLFENNENDALIPVQEEITKRVLTPDGNLYNLKDKPKGNTTRNVYLVIFEGNGAAGNGNFALVSRAYLTDKAYEEIGSTFLAHEFYHTLGLPDNYIILPRVYSDTEQTKVSYPTYKDIMGIVTIPLPYTYIDEDSLKKMGL